MDKRSKIILLIVVFAFVLVIAAKPFFKNQRETATGEISNNPDYSQVIAEAKAQGQPVFLEFYGAS